jgi:hypothetical protein
VATSEKELEPSCLASVGVLYEEGLAGKRGGRKMVEWVVMLGLKGADLADWGI